ncbi:CaiB/BaiF CoA-transferase family protein [Thalassobaculum sp.]|uniref:CaiB/BaiF CoA-transferase family protein n=1 Tax=Thalassobaculum sp. TaxID=2022740 RepID=UPI0032EEEBE4
MLPPLRIVEFAEGVAGPLAALRLGDLGADVVKIEAEQGDWLRGCPPFLSDGRTSAAFFSLNRGKRALGLGARPATAGDLLRRLLETADVLITDRTLEELEALGIRGLGEEVWAANQRLVTVCISPFGDAGPLTGKPASELTAQAMAGYTRYLGSRDRPAERLGADVAGVSTGIFATQAALAALLWRRRSGRGQRVSVSMLNSLLSMKTVHLAAQSDPDEYSGPRVGGANDPPDRGWATGDSPITFMFGGSVGAEGRPGWVQFVEQMGLEWMLDDPRFDKAGRETTGLGPKARTLKPEYESAFVKRGSAEIVDAVRALGGLGSAYQTPAEAIAHPQAVALGVTASVPGPDGSLVSVLGFPARFSESAAAPGGDAPAIGGHSATICAELGLSDSEIRRLVSAGGLVVAGTAG